MRKQKGFSLIELLIVVAIILIIAAIAIPNLLRARIAANESSAAASVRTLATAELTYQTSYGVYATAIGNLGPASTAACTSPTSTNACIIDYNLATATSTSALKSGYYFSATTPAALQYFITATPGSAGSSGVKGFCAVEDNVVRFNNPYAAVSSHDNCLGLAAIGN